MSNFGNIKNIPKPKTGIDYTGFAFPKPGKKEKKPPTGIKRVGKRTAAWMEGQPKLKETFRENGIVSCEIILEGCKDKYLLGFAHITKRGNYDVEELVDPHVVVLACQYCHEIVDNASKMPKAEAEELLSNIVKSRGW